MTSLTIIIPQPKYDKRKKEALKAIKKDSEKEEKEAQLDMIEYHGSKMASVVSFMKKLLKNPDNRAIVFSSVRRSQTQITSAFDNTDSVA